MKQEESAEWMAAALVVLLVLGVAVTTAEIVATENHRDKPMPAMMVGNQLWIPERPSIKKFRDARGVVTSRPRAYRPVLTRESEAARRGREANAAMRFLPLNGPVAVSEPPPKWRLTWAPKGASLIGGHDGIEASPGIFTPPIEVNYLGVGIAPAPELKAVFMKE